MPKNIPWEEDMRKALARAAGENKPILLDFFNPEWIGCQQMDAVTYPQSEVAEFVSQHVVPLRIPNDAQPYATEFGVVWTPCIVALDPLGKEHYRSVGWLSPEELIPSLLLRTGRIHFDGGRQKEALKAFQQVIDEHSKSYAAPEAVYYRGVARYKDTGKGGPLKEAHETLSAQYPESEWAMRARPYRLL